MSSSNSASPFTHNLINQFPFYAYIVIFDHSQISLIWNEQTLPCLFESKVIEILMAVFVSCVYPTCAVWKESWVLIYAYIPSYIDFLCNAYISTSSWIDSPWHYLGSEVVWWSWARKIFLQLDLVSNVGLGK